VNVGGVHEVSKVVAVRATKVYVNWRVCSTHSKPSHWLHAAVVVLYNRRKRCCCPLHMRLVGWIQRWSGPFGADRSLLPLP